MSDLPAPPNDPLIASGPHSELAAGAAREIADSLTPRLGNLTPRQKLFVLFLANPDNPGTYLKPTEAYARAYGIPDQRRATAHVNSHRLLKSVKIQSEVELVLAGMGLPVGIRTVFLGQIAAGAGTRTVVRRRYRYVTRDGERVRELVAEDEREAPPTFLEQLKANEVLNRLTGANEQGKAVGDAARREVSAALRDSDRLGKLAAKRRAARNGTGT